jgi:hypothetical protein
MRWMHILAVAVLTGVVGLFASSVAASLAVHWYDVNAFEVRRSFRRRCCTRWAEAGGVVRIAASMLVRTARDSNTEAMGSFHRHDARARDRAHRHRRILADIPPVIDGEPLFLSVELRAPASASPASYRRRA